MADQAPKQWAQMMRLCSEPQSRSWAPKCAYDIFESHKLNDYPRECRPKCGTRVPIRFIAFDATEGEHRVYPPLCVAGRASSPMPSDISKFIYAENARIKNQFNCMTFTFTRNFFSNLGFHRAVSLCRTPETNRFAAYKFLLFSHLHRNIQSLMDNGKSFRQSLVVCICEIEWISFCDTSLKLVWS